MQVRMKWVAGALAGVLLVVGAGVFAAQQWAGTESLRLRLEREATAALGLPVGVRALSLELWPLPAVAAEGLQVRSVPLLTVERIALRPAWGALLVGRFEIASLAVRGARVPQQAISAISAAQDKKAPRARRIAQAPADTASAPIPWPRHWVIDELTWIGSNGRSTTLDGRATLDADQLPATALLQVRQGWLAGARLDLRRTGMRWDLDGTLGGGTVRGPFTLARSARGSYTLGGDLATQGVEVSAFTAPSRTLTGRLEAQTRVNAEFNDPAKLMDVLRTQTRFSVRDAVVHGLDLARAAQTAGTSSGGQTRLDTLAGQLATQGRAAQLSRLVASSGLLAATGDVALAADRRLSGRISVDVAGGALAVPLVVGGTLDDPSVAPNRAALLGAALGTAAAPGPGTLAGARLGERLGRLFDK